MWVCLPSLHATSNYLYNTDKTHLVKGIVVDNEGLEVIGASVRVKGLKNQGVITDTKGKFQISVPNLQNAVLLFSYIGMKDKEVELKGRDEIKVVMEFDTYFLDEVVAIGYAKVKRRDLTGSVSSVSSEEISKTPGSNISLSLVGRMPGVQVLQSEGSPDSSISIRVRGGISITQSNEPLYIIDGFPSEDGLNSLDPADIETIDVLKDASSTAIYGARGANGVVVVTTKSGGIGNKTVVTLDSYVGFRNMSKKLDLFSPYEFVLADYERCIYNTETEEDFNEEVARFESIYGKFADLEKNYANRKGIDWQDETLGRTALTQNYRVGISGGQDKVKYNVAFSHYDEEGAMVYSGMRKYNVLFNLKSKVNDWLSVNARITYDQRKVRGMGTSGDGSSGTGDRFNKMQHILQYRPTAGINMDDSFLLEDEDPILLDDSGNVMQNPLISAKEEHKVTEFRTIQANGGFTINLLKNLTFANTSGMRYQTRRYNIFFGAKSVVAKRSSIHGSLENRDYGSFQTSNVLTYSLNKADHSFTAMAGQEWVSSWNRRFKAAATNFKVDDIGLADLSLGLPAPPSSNQNFDDKLLSFFGRLNYSYRSKYLFSLSLRADGSSKFGKNNKWGYFPAFSGAWRMNEEPFIAQLGIFSDLKIRLGYGLAGNNRIQNYQSLSIMDSVTYPDGTLTQPGYISKQIPNPDLKWEANMTFNLGVDFGFLNQRIIFTPEFYINKSNDLLLNAKIPTSSGYNAMILNAGETKNSGIDLALHTINISKKDFSWKSSFMLSHNKNKITKLTGEDLQLWEAKFGYSQNTHIVEVGKSIGQFYGLVTDGIYQVSDFDYDSASGVYSLKDGVPYMGKKANVKPGMWKFKNLDGSEDNLITESDKTVIGNACPKFYGSINNTFLWKNFDLSIYFTYSYGNDVFNATKLTNSRFGQKNRNALSVADSKHRFVLVDQNGMKINDPTRLAEINKGKTFSAVYDNEIGDMYIHSWAVEDGSYFKLNNITIGYNFPHKVIDKIGLQSLRLYATGSNLCTFTKYSGYDPESSTFKNGLTPGVDFGAYPRSRTFVFGVNLAF